MSKETTVDYIIEITPDAQTELGEIVKERTEKSLFLKLNIEPGGCSGSSYTLSFVESKNSTDIQEDYADFKLLIPLESLEELKGTVIDYYKDEFQSGFVIENPSKPKSGGCGCGCSC